MTEPGTDPPEDVLDTGRAGGLVMRGGIYRLLGFGAGSVLAAASVILLTRHLGVSGYGRYVTIVALATLVTQVTEGGLTSLAIRDYVTVSPERRPKLVADRLGLQLATVVMAVAICVLLSLAFDYDSDRVWASAAAAAGLGLASLQITVGVPLTGELRFGVTSALELLRQALLVAITVGLIVVGAGLLPFLVAIIPSSLAALALTWAVANRVIPIRASLDPAAWRALARPALIVSLSAGLATIYLFTTQILTSLVASAHETGLFAASVRVFAVAAGLPGLVVAATLPLLSRAARHDEERMRTATQRLFEVAVVAGTGVAVVMAAGAHTIIAVLAGSQFKGSVVPLQIEAAAVLGSCLTPVWSTALLALHRHRDLLISNVIVLSAAVVLTLTLAPLIGARGAATATVGGELLAAFTLAVFLVRSDRRFRPRARPVLPRVAAAAVPVLALLWVPMPDGLRLVAAIALYGVLALALRILPSELLELVPARLSSRRADSLRGDAARLR